MIVCITEHYDGNGSVTWFADMSKARQVFVNTVNKALHDPYKTIGIVSGLCGWQEDNDRNSCSVSLPCQVDDAIELFTE